MTAALPILTAPAGVTAVHQVIWLLTAPARLLMVLVSLVTVLTYTPRHAASRTPRHLISTAPAARPDTTRGVDDVSTLLPFDDAMERLRAGTLDHDETHWLLAITYEVLLDTARQRLREENDNARDEHNEIDRAHRDRWSGCTVRWWEVVS